MLSFQLEICVQNGMNQVRRKISSFHNCSQTYGEDRYTFPYVFMKEYESRMQDVRERRERKIRDLPDEKINLYLAYDHRKSGLYYWGSGPNVFLKHQAQLPQTFYFIR